MWQGGVHTWQQYLQDKPCVMSSCCCPVTEECGTVILLSQVDCCWQIDSNCIERNYLWLVIWHVSYCGVTLRIMILILNDGPVFLWNLSDFVRPLDGCPYFHQTSSWVLMYRRSKYWEEPDRSVLSTLTSPSSNADCMLMSTWHLRFDLLVYLLRHIFHIWISSTFIAFTTSQSLSLFLPFLHGFLFFYYYKYSKLNWKNNCSKFLQTL